MVWEVGIMVFPREQSAFNPRIALIEKLVHVPTGSVLLEVFQRV